MVNVPPDATDQSESTLWNVIEIEISNSQSESSCDFSSEQSRWKEVGTWMGTRCRWVPEPMRTEPMRTEPMRTEPMRTQASGPGQGTRADEVNRADENRADI